MSNINRLTRQYQRWLLIILALTIFLITYQAPQFLPHGDAWGSMITAQQIITKGTLRLDPYMNQFLLNGQPNYRFIQVGEHYYYYFPPGTPLLISPIVGIANLFGLDMMVDDALLQKLLLAWSAAAAIILIYHISRLYVTPLASFLFTIGFTFGSAIIGTLGTAFWPQNLTTILILALLYCLAAHDTNQERSLNPYLLALLLFLGFICRPSALLFLPIVFVYLFLKSKIILIKFIISFILLIVIFVVYCAFEYRLPLPPYYIQRGGNVREALLISTAAHLFSPARGIFIYQPYLLFGVIGSFVLILKRRVGWPVLCLLISVSFNFFPVAKLPHWWGGWSYGSRLFTEFLPCLYIAFLVSWQQLVPRFHRYRQLTLISLMLILFVFSIYINTYQGLYNLWVQRWNGAGTAFNIDNNPEYLFSWRYPQFLASPALVEARNLDWRIRNLPELELGQPVTAGSSMAVFEQQEAGETKAAELTASPYTRIWFRLGDIAKYQRIRAVFESCSFKSFNNNVQVVINNHVIGTLPELANSAGGFYTLSIEPGLLKSGDINTIVLQPVSLVRSVASDMPAGICLRSLQIDAE